MLMLRPPYAVLLITLLLFLPLSHHGFARLTSNFVTYDNSNLGIKIQYPSDWQVEPDPELNTTAFLVPGSPIKYAEKLDITILDAKPGKSLTDIANDLIQFNKQNDGSYQVIESSPIIVNGNSAYKIVHSFNEPTKFGEVKAMLIEIIKGNKQYELLYTAEPEKYDMLLPTIQKMIDSFQITK